MMNFRTSFPLIPFFAVVFFSILAGFRPDGAMAQSTLGVGALISEAESAADSLIQQGFDRLDRSMVIAGYEAKDTIRTMRAELEGVLETAADKLDEQRSKVVSDLQLLTRTMRQAGADVVQEVRAASVELQSTLTVLVDDSIGSLQIVPDVIVGDAEFIDVTLRGVALSQLVIEELRLLGKAAEYTVTHQDDQRVTLRINASPVRALRSETITGEPLDVPVSFIVVKPRWFEFFRGRLERSFAATFVSVPEEIGVVTAIYVGSERVSVDTVRQETRETPRVQASERLFPPEIRRGSWGGPFSFQAASGAIVVPESISLNLSGGDGCHGSSTAASIASRSDSGFLVNVSVATDRRLGATCRGVLSVSYTERTFVDQQAERRDSREGVVFGERVVFSSADVASGVSDVRIAYYEVDSPLFSGGPARLLPGETSSWAEVEVDPATGYSYVTVSLN